ncbi:MULTISPECIES: hypothetical protein [unclassified Aeromicrobium]|nr:MULTISPECIES: hypothetical protein [unclassified Aeromicrobium]
MDRARFCLATGIQPSEYDRLTQADLNAFTQLVNEQQQTTT